VHGDIKPENFLLGPPGTPTEKKLYLVDLGYGLVDDSRHVILHVYMFGPCPPRRSPHLGPSFC